MIVVSLCPQLTQTDHDHECGGGWPRSWMCGGGL